MMETWGQGLTPRTSLAVTAVGRREGAGAGGGAAVPPAFGEFQGAGRLARSGLGLPCALLPPTLVPLHSCALLSQPCLQITLLLHRGAGEFQQSGPAKFLELQAPCATKNPPPLPSLAKNTMETQQRLRNVPLQLPSSAQSRVLVQAERGSRGDLGAGGVCALGRTSPVSHWGHKQARQQGGAFQVSSQVLPPEPLLG